MDPAEFEFWPECEPEIRKRFIRSDSGKVLFGGPDTLPRNLKIGWLMRKAQNATKLIQEIYRRVGGPILVAWSGGRDSTLILKMATKVVPKTDLVAFFNDTGIEFTETTSYVKAMAEKWDLNLHVAKSEYNFWEGIKEYGFPSMSNRWCCRTQKENPSLKAYDEIQPRVVLTGLRRMESKRRRSYLVIKYFPFAKRVWDRKTLYLNPIVDWSKWDVRDFCALINLPLNPLYQKGYSRVGCWPCPMSPKLHYLQLKKHHPKLYYAIRQFLQPTKKLTHYQ